RVLHRRPVCRETHKESRRRGVDHEDGGARVGCRFFFQAEDGIRDGHVTGVQTCALPICDTRSDGGEFRLPLRETAEVHQMHIEEIGRASCRERVEMTGALVSLKIITAESEAVMRTKKLEVSTLSRDHG